MYQSVSGMPEDSQPGIKQFSWHDLATSDYQAAFAFYSDLFEWSKTEDLDMGAAGIDTLHSPKPGLRQFHGEPALVRSQVERAQVA